MKKRLLVLSALALFLHASSRAYDFEEGGVYYNILSEEDLTCEVTYGGTSFLSALYSGSVSIPEAVIYGNDTCSVVAIGDYAFAYCGDLAEVTIPGSVTDIGYCAFNCCTGLAEAVIPENATEIGGYAFADCTGLTRVTIGEGVKEIGYAAFCGCIGLTEVVIPGSVTEMGGYAFADCTGLTEVTLSDGVTGIGKNAFYGCIGLTEVTIPESVMGIDNEAFAYCYGLTRVAIPGSVVAIGSFAFGCCTGLKEFEVAEGSEYFCAVDGVLYTKDMATLVQFPLASPLLPYFDIPDGVAVIGDLAFLGCDSLAEVFIPGSVAEIGFSAFEGCTGLAEAVIPENVTEIGGYAFTDCTGLTRVTSLNPEPPTCGRRVFSGVDTDTCVLYVPEGTKEAYSTATWWKDFFNIVEIDPAAVEGVAAGGDYGAAAARYMLDGRRISTPQRGVNILRRKDGTAKKVLVK